MAKKKTLSGEKTQTETIEPQASVQENAALSGIDSEQRYGMIAEVAYFIAEQRGFQGEAELDDWLHAEADVDARLSSDTQVSH